MSHVFRMSTVELANVSAMFPPPGLMHADVSGAALDTVRYKIVCAVSVLPPLFSSLRQQCSSHRIGPRNVLNPIATTGG